MVHPNDGKEFLAGVVSSFEAYSGIQVQGNYSCILNFVTYILNLIRTSDGEQ